MRRKECTGIQLQGKMLYFSCWSGDEGFLCLLCHLLKLAQSEIIPIYSHSILAEKCWWL